MDSFSNLELQVLNSRIKYLENYLQTCDFCELLLKEELNQLKERRDSIEFWNQKTIFSQVDLNQIKKSETLWNKILASSKGEEVLFFGFEPFLEIRDLSILSHDNYVQILPSCFSLYKLNGFGSLESLNTGKVESIYELLKNKTWVLTKPLDSPYEVFNEDLRQDYK